MPVLATMETYRLQAKMPARMLFLAFFVLLSVTGYGQTTEKSYGRIAVEFSKQKRPKKTYARVEIVVPFPGGDSAWIKSYENGLDSSVPFRNGAPVGTYFVYVQFIVTKDGVISDIRPLTNHGYGMEAEAVRALKKRPVWTPASDGRTVREYEH